MDMNMNMNVHFINQFPELNPSMLEDFNTADFSVVETLLAHQQPVLQATSFTSNLSSTSHVDGFNAAQYFHAIPSAKDACHESKKRKVMELSKNISSSAIDLKEDTRTKKKKNSLGRGNKAGMSNDKEVDMAQEVIHVRSRRGKATDSHSLAERVRREKINYKLRCLQELVPGCYKTMGMAVMLDEIINYVQSLQNQVEFLSMELAAASSFYDLNMEKEAIRNVQGTSTHDTQEIEKLARRGYGGHICFL